MNQNKPNLIFINACEGLKNFHKVRAVINMPVDNNLRLNRKASPPYPHGSFWN